MPPSPKLPYVLLASDGNSPLVVVDFSEVSFIDSTGLSALILGFKQLRKHGGDLRLVGFQPRAQRVLSQRCPRSSPFTRTSRMPCPGRGISLRVPREHRIFLQSATNDSQWEVSSARSRVSGPGAGNGLRMCMHLPPGVEVLAVPQKNMKVSLWMTRTVESLPPILAR